MIIGIIGAPNKGKSSFFSCVTHFDAQIANYPFTTIDPNKAVAYLKVKCPSTELGVKSNPRNGRLQNGMRDVPVQLIDVAGLVPNAHEGKGMGNKFLDDLCSANGFLQIIDASAKTDLEGNPVSVFDLQKEIEFLDTELRFWILSILKRNTSKYKGRDIDSLCSVLSGLSYSPELVKKCARTVGIDQKKINADEKEIERLSLELSKNAKPKIIVANKCDLKGAMQNARELAKKTQEQIVCASAQYEQVLQIVKKRGLIRYMEGSNSFEIISDVDEKQKQALQKIAKFLQENDGTGVHRALHKLVFDKIGMIVVYPVENEKTYADSNGNVLPDALLMPRGSTVIELAQKVHADLAKKFIGAIDARKKIRVAKEHPLKNGDVIKIISGR